MNNNVKGELSVMDSLGIKPNYAALGRKYGVERIGSYANFNRFVKVNKLKPKTKTQRHPRFEKKPGKQGQVDWKISIVYGLQFYLDMELCSHCWVYLIIEYCKGNFCGVKYKKCMVIFITRVIT